jgi:hypothetical protein
VFGCVGVVNAVLDAITERMHHDGRFTDRHLSRRQQAAEALEEMAVRASGPHPDKPSVHPEIVVLVPHEQLTQPDPDPLGPPPELVGTGPISIDDVIRLALLDATARTLTLDGNGVPLNLGRGQRLANHDQWIFLLVRDRGCVVPGCARPATWCSSRHRPSRRRRVGESAQPLGIGTSRTPHNCVSLSRRTLPSLACSARGAGR